MHVEQNENILSIKISPKEILAYFSDARVDIEDFEYLCGLIYLIALSKKRKKSALNSPMGHLP